MLVERELGVWEKHPSSLLPKWVISLESVLPPGKKLCEYLGQTPKAACSQAATAWRNTRTCVSQTPNYRYLWLNPQSTILGVLMTLCSLCAESVLIAGSVNAGTSRVWTELGPACLSLGQQSFWLNSAGCYYLAPLPMFSAEWDRPLDIASKQTSKTSEKKGDSLQIFELSRKKKSSKFLRA